MFNTKSVKQASLDHNVHLACAEHTVVGVHPYVLQILSEFPEISSIAIMRMLGVGS